MIRSDRLSAAPRGDVPVRRLIQLDDGFYFPISPYMIFPEAYGEFAVFVKKGRNHILFTRQGEHFSDRHKAILHDNGIQEVYIQLSQKPTYDRCLEENLGRIMLDESIPLSVRSHVLYYLATSTVNDVFENNSDSLSPAAFSKLDKIVRSSLGFFSYIDNALSSLARTMSSDLGLHIHSANVFFYSAAIMASCNIPAKDRVSFGLGAILHDIGKTSVPKQILNKRGKHNTEERALFRLHPVRGAGMCALLPVGQIAMNCLLFHHEKLDASGYPAGLAGDNIPLHARILSVVDSFDTLTSARPFAEALSPHQALKMLAEQMTGRYDLEIIKILADVLVRARML
ncbi:MAG: HD-GYP domain-containing protein [Syntrophobacteraceae bacterium]